MDSCSSSACFDFRLAAVTDLTLTSNMLDRAD